MAGVEGHEGRDEIRVMDLDTMNIYRCGVKAPVETMDSYAIIMNQSSEQEMIVTGFANQNSDYDVPFYLMKLIERWYYREVIYFFCGNRIWKIGVDSIINNLKDRELMSNYFL